MTEWNVGLNSLVEESHFQAPILHLSQICKLEYGFRCLQESEFYKGDSNKKWFERMELGMHLGLSIMTYGLLLSIVLSTIVLVTMYYNPRLLLQSYPTGIQKVVAEKTKYEIMLTKFVGIFFMFFLIGIPVVSTLFLKQSYGGEISFLVAFINMFGIITVFNVVDWLIIDWLLICNFTPKFVIIKGTEGMSEYKNYFHHFRGFVIGICLSLVTSLVLATVISLL